MGAFKNHASTEYRSVTNDAVYNELLAAGIPILTLPAYQMAEVKTNYVGILNGFVFTRAWRYWVCSGDMPLANAKEIYATISQLAVRAEGHAGNIDPEGYSPQMKQLLTAKADEMREKGCSAGQIFAALENIPENPQWPRYVRQYHIDTSEGLKALADYIKSNRVYAHNGEDGSYAVDVQKEAERRADL